MDSPAQLARVGLALFIVVSLADGASASPWTLRRGQVALVAGFDYQWADSEFLDDPSFAPRQFPLDGIYRSSSVTVGARAGLTDRLELELQVPVRLVSYTADPVILLPVAAAGGASVDDFVAQNIIDLSRSRQGLGDIVLSARYGLLRNPLALALEVRLKTPTGYDRPQGTFGERPVDAQDFLDNLTTYVRPDNVTDDVVLGDGQVDIQTSMLLGVSFRTRTFMRFDAGFNARIGAGQQVVGSLKIGQLIGKRFLLFADTRLVYSVTQGPRIGISVAAIDPTLPAERYLGTDNLMLRELRLERDAWDVSVGGIVRITDAAELNLAYQRTIWGRNTAALNAFFLAFGVRTDFLPEPEAPPEPQEIEQVEEEYVEYVEELPTEDGSVDVSPSGEESPAAAPPPPGTPQTPDPEAPDGVPAVSEPEAAATADAAAD